MSSSTPPHIGIAEIDRKYEVLSQLGEGGMGEIYKARHLHLDEVRVLKTIRPQLRDNQELQARFLREARLATRLRHRNIAAIHDFVVEDDGTACIVMEFIDGSDLAHRMRSAEPLDRDGILEVARQTLDALDYLHRRQIVHRDISPDNIMLTESLAGDLLVKLIDMGIAKPLDGSQWQTRAEMFIGKVRYSSPEQLGASGDREIDGRSDLYSLGVVICEALTGVLPITGTDQSSLIAGHLFHPPRSFDETDPQGRVSPPLREVLTRAIAKSPDERFQDATAFVAALDAAAAEGARSLDRTVFEPIAPEVAERRREAADPTTVAPATSGTAPPAPSAAGEGVVEPTTAAAAPAAGDPTTLTPHEGAPGTPAPTVLGGGSAAPPAADPTTVSPATPPTTAAPPPAIPPTTVAPAPSDAEAPGPRRSRLPLVAAATLVLLLAAVAVWWATRGEAPASTAALAALDYGDFHAVVIGNDRYAYLPELETATRDARALADLLERKYGFAVRVLLDATRNEIITALSDVSSALTASDNLLVFYAGHGRLDGRNQSGYWQPVDADPLDTSQWISTTHTLAALLDRTVAPRVLVIADSCFSGTLSDAAMLSGDAGDASWTLEEVEEVLGFKARLAFTSGGLSPVLDSGRGNHSVFAGELLRRLEANDGVLAASTLYRQTADPVASGARDLGVSQLPQFAPIPGTDDGGGEFFFVPRQASARRP